MKKGRLSFVLSVLIMSISMIAICAIIIVPTIKFGDDSGNGTIHINKNYETNAGTPGVSNPSNDNANKEEISTVEFFINEQTISKTKHIVGETTMFTVSFKVFALNKTDSTKTIKASAFAGSYAIGEFASFYKFEYNDSENTKIVPAGESEDFDFSLCYVITDTNNFKDTEKYNLTVKYMSAEVISANI